MPEYTPKDMPEITVIYDYQPEEWDRGCRVCPANVEILHLEINGDVVVGILEDYLIETFGDTWEEEIIDGQKKRRLVGTV